MAKQLLLSGIKRVLSAYVEEGAKLEAQVASGRLELSELRLRQELLEGCAAAAGCCLVRCTSCVAKLSVSWSWTGLLSSPIKVAIEGLELAIAITPRPVGTEESVAGEKVQVGGVPGSFARRIWDQLSVSIGALQVSCEVLQSAEAARACGTLGLVWQQLAVVSNKGEEGLEQILDLKGLGLFLLPPGQESAEPQEHFVLRPTSPSSRALRRSGRRFVDWRGLELSFALGAPEIRLTDAQRDCLPRLWRCLTELSPISAKSSSSQDWEIVALPEAQPTTPVQAARRSWLPSLSRWWSTAEAAPPSRSSSLSELISESDQAILSVEEAPAGDLAEFKLAISWEEASLVTPEELLSLRGNGRVSCVVPAGGAWSVEAGLTVDLRDRHFAALPVCAPRASRQGDDILLRADGHSMQLEVNPLDIFPTKAALDAVQFFQDLASALPSEAKEEVAEAVVEALETAKAALSLKIKQPRLLLGGCEAEEQLVCELADLTLERSAAGVTKCTMAGLQSGLSGSCLLEPCSLSVSPNAGGGWSCVSPSIAARVSPADLPRLFSVSSHLQELFRGAAPASQPAVVDGKEACTQSLDVDVATFTLSLVGSEAPSLGVVFTGGLTGNSHGQLDLRLSTRLEEGSSPRSLFNDVPWAVSVRQGELKVRCADSFSVEFSSADMGALQLFGNQWMAAIPSSGPAEGVKEASDFKVLLEVPRTRLVMALAEGFSLSAEGEVHLTMGGGGWSAGCQLSRATLRDTAVPQPVLERRGEGPPLSLRLSEEEVQVVLPPMLFAPTSAFVSTAVGFLKPSTSPAEAPPAKSKLKVEVIAKGLRLLLPGGACALALEAEGVSASSQAGSVGFKLDAFRVELAGADAASAVGILDPCACTMSLGEQQGKVHIDDVSLQLAPSHIPHLKAAGAWLQDVLQDSAVSKAKDAAAASEPKEGHTFPLQLTVASLKVSLLGQQALAVFGSLEVSSECVGSWCAAATLGFSMGPSTLLQQCKWDIARCDTGSLSVACAQCPVRCTVGQLRTLYSLTPPWYQALGAGVLQELSAGGGQEDEQVSVQANLRLSCSLDDSGAWSLEAGLGSETRLLDSNASWPVFKPRETSVEVASFSANRNAVELRLGSWDIAPTTVAMVALRRLASAVPDSAGSSSGPGVAVKASLTTSRLLLRGKGEGEQLLCELGQCVVQQKQGDGPLEARLENLSFSTAGRLLLEPCSCSVLLREDGSSWQVPKVSASFVPADLARLSAVAAKVAEDLGLGPAEQPVHAEVQVTKRHCVKLGVFSVTLSGAAASDAALLLRGSLDGSFGAETQLDMTLSAMLRDGQASPQLCSDGKWAVSLGPGGATARCSSCIMLTSRSSDLIALQRLGVLWSSALPASSGSGPSGTTKKLEVLLPEAKIAVALEQSGEFQLIGHLGLQSDGGTWAVSAGLSELLFKDHAGNLPLRALRPGLVKDIISLQASARAVRVEADGLEVTLEPAGLQAVKQLQSLCEELSASSGAGGSSTEPAMDIDVILKSPRLLFKGAGGCQLALEAKTLHVGQQAGAFTAKLETCRLLLASAIIMEPCSCSVAWEGDLATVRVSIATLRIAHSQLQQLQSMATSLASIGKAAGATTPKVVDAAPSTASKAFRVQVSIGTATVFLAGPQETLALVLRLDASFTSGGQASSSFHAAADLEALLGQGSSSQGILREGHWELTWSATDELRAGCADCQVRLTFAQLAELRVLALAFLSAAEAGKLATSREVGAASSAATLAVSNACITVCEKHGQPGAKLSVVEGTLVSRGPTCLFSFSSAVLAFDGTPGKLSASAAQLRSDGPQHGQQRLSATVDTLALLDVDGGTAMQARSLQASASLLEVTAVPSLHATVQLEGVTVDTSERFLCPLLAALAELGGRLGEVVAPGPSLEREAKLDVSGFPVEVRRFAVEKAGLGAQVEHASLKLDRVSLPAQRTTFSGIGEKVAEAYKGALASRVPVFATVFSFHGLRVGDAATGLGSAVGQLAMGAGALGTTLGAAAVKGAAAAIVASKAKGKELRGGDCDNYQVGDVARGLSSLLQEPCRSASAAVDFVKKEQVASSTVGALVGGAVGLVAGPVGSVAGGAAGSALGRKVSNVVASTADRGREARGGEDGYRFGDFTIGVIAAATGSGSRNEAEICGKWRYDDINFIAKKNPIRFTNKPSLGELRKDISEQAQSGRPIYVELDTPGTPHCRVFPERAAAVSWLANFQTPAAAASATASQSPGSMQVAFPARTSNPSSAVQAGQPASVAAHVPLDLLDEVTAASGGERSAPARDLLGGLGPTSRRGGTRSTPAAPHPLMKGASLLD